MSAPSLPILLKINGFIGVLELLQNSSAPQAKSMVFSHKKIVFSIEKTTTMKNCKSTNIFTNGYPSSSPPLLEGISELE